MPNRDVRQKNTRNIAFCGILAALGVTVMTLGGLVPFATYCCPLLASLVLLPAMDECGPAMSVGLYAVIGILSMLLAPDKEAAFLFVFMGYYPVLKVYIDGLRRKALRILCKLALFNLAILSMYWLLASVIGMQQLVAEQQTYSQWMVAALLLLGNLAFALFDVALVRLQAVYRRRLHPQVKKLFS